MKLCGPHNVSEHFWKDTVVLIRPRIEPRFLGRPEVFLNVSTALRRSPAPSCEQLQHAGKHICADVNQCALHCHALPCACLSELVLSTGSPRIFTLFTQARRKEFLTKRNNKPDLRENRILQWHFAWKKMTRQSNVDSREGSCLQRRINTRWAAEHRLIDTPFQFAWALGLSFHLVTKQFPWRCALPL